MRRISFIVSTYNCENFVEECINSVISQISDKDELVLVDDGSSDGTRDVLKKYEDRLVWYDFPFEEVGIEGYEQEYEQDYKGRYEALSIDITDFEKIKEYDMFPNKKGYAIIISNTSHLERAIEFLEYLDTP